MNVSAHEIKHAFGVDFQSVADTEAENERLGYRVSDTLKFDLSRWTVTYDHEAQEAFLSALDAIRGCVVDIWCDGQTATGRVTNIGGGWITLDDETDFEISRVQKIHVW